MWGNTNLGICPNVRRFQPFWGSNFNFPSTFGLQYSTWLCGVADVKKKESITSNSLPVPAVGCIYTKAANWIAPLICKHFKIRVPTNISQTCIKSESNKWFLVSPLIPLWFSDFDRRLPSSSKSPLLTAAKSNKYLAKKPNAKKENMEKRWEKMVQETPWHIVQGVWNTFVQGSHHCT